MANIVVCWLCKCGIRLKVVAESDFSPASATTTALCPKCGDPQPVHADKIISVTEDTSDRSPALAPCGEKERLLVAKSNAFDIYTRGVKELAEAAGMIAHAEFVFLYDKVLSARQSLSEASQQLIEHTAKHGCY